MLKRSHYFVLLITLTFLITAPALADELTERLTKAIESPKPLVRRTAIDILMTKGEAAKDAVPAVTKRLDDESLEVRISAIEFLGHIRTGDEDVLEALLTLLHDKNPRIRTKAALAVGNFGSLAVDPLKPLLSNTNVATRETAILAVGALGTSGVKLEKEVLAALGDESLVVRRNAALALGQIGASSAVPTMVKALSDKDTIVRQNLITALGQLAPKSIPAVAALVSHLGDPDRLVREFSFSALSQLKPETVLVPLTQGLAAKDPLARQGSAKLIGELGAKGANAVPALIGALDDDSVEVRRNVVEALGKIESAESSEALLATLRDNDDGIRIHAIKALEGRSVKAAIAPLTETLNDENPLVHTHALRTLGKFGRDSAPAVPHIAKNFSKDSSVAFAQRSALWDIGTTEAIEALVTQAKKEKVFPACTKHSACEPEKIKQMGMDIRYWTVFCDRSLCRQPQSLDEWATACAAVTDQADSKQCLMSAMPLVRDADEAAGFAFCNTAYSDKTEAERCRLDFCGYSVRYLQHELGESECASRARASSCADKIKNGRETDTDCGGPDCGACDLKQACLRNQDCASGACDRGIHNICVQLCPDGTIKKNGPCGCRWKGEDEPKVIDFKNVLSQGQKVQQPGILHCCSGLAFWMDSSSNCP